MELHKEMKITELGIDCLEKIFRNVCVADLLNLADSNKDLGRAAELTFALQHGKKSVEIGGLGSCPKVWYVCEDIQVIHTTFTKRTLQMLRCFGHLISKLEINIAKRYFEPSCVSFDSLIAYVEEFCMESLSAFTILGEPGGVLNCFVKPFVNVECWRSNI